MSDRKYPALLGLAVILSLIGLLLMAGAPAPSYALPGRDTPTPVLRDDDSNDDRPVGAYIELHVQGAPAGAWVVVQWQAQGDGGWHDVAGWQGTLDAGGGRRWWVDARDFGKGPFRWAVSQGPGGPVVAVSQPFYLPGAAGETVAQTLTWAR